MASASFSSSCKKAPARLVLGGRRGFMGKSGERPRRFPPWANLSREKMISSICLRSCLSDARIFEISMSLIPATAFCPPWEVGAAF